MQEIDPQFRARLLAWKRMNEIQIATPNIGPNKLVRPNTGLDSQWHHALETTYSIYETAYSLDIATHDLGNFDASHSRDPSAIAREIAYLGTTWVVWAYALITRTRDVLQKQISKVIYRDDQISKRFSSQISTLFRQHLSETAEYLQKIRHPALHIYGRLKGDADVLRSPARGITEDGLWEAASVPGLPPAEGFSAENERWKEHRLATWPPYFRARSEDLLARYKAFVDEAKTVGDRP